MAPAALLVVMVVAQAAQMIMQNKALSDEQDARNDAAKRQNDELMRQRSRENAIAAAKKSDAARKADRELGTALTILGESGGTSASASRAAGEIGGILGLDIARIEGNRVERNEARRAQGISIIENADAANSAAASQKTANVFSFVGKAAGTAMGSPGATKSLTSSVGNIFSNSPAKMTAANAPRSIEFDP
jgi:hypothetical protein